MMHLPAILITEQRASGVPRRVFSQVLQSQRAAQKMRVEKRKLGKGGWS
jgi:hypothetical protein